MENNLSIAIVVIAYNRDRSLVRLLQSVNDAYIDAGTTLIISIDKSKNPKVEEEANSFNWAHGEKRVIAHRENLGLRKHILGCGKYLDEFDAIIVLEDDLVVSKNFYNYATQTVAYYKDDEQIAGISLYQFLTNYQTFNPFYIQNSCYDTYFMRCAQSWGQVWMKKQWKSFEKWYEINKDTVFDKTKLPESICTWSSKSWLKYHTRYCVETSKYFVYPCVSLTSNSGECGTHLDFATPIFQTNLQELAEDYRYRLAPFNSDSVKYDGLFENEEIYNKLGISENDLCVRLNSKDAIDKNKRYVLTTASLPFRVINSFGLSLIPIELNVLNQVSGNLIFLYDTSIQDAKPKQNARQLFAYYYRTDIFMTLRRLAGFGMKNIIMQILHKI